MRSRVLGHDVLHFKLTASYLLLFSDANIKRGTSLVFSSLRIMADPVRLIHLLLEDCVVCFAQEDCSD